MPVIHDTGKARVWTLVSADLLNRNTPHRNNTFSIFQMLMMQISLSLGSEQPPGRFVSKNKRAAGANRNKH